MTANPADTTERLMAMAVQETPNISRGWQKLSAEVVGRILETLDRRDLKSCRLVSTPETLYLANQNKATSFTVCSNKGFRG